MTKSGPHTYGTHNDSDVPIVDISPFTSNGNLESRKRAAQELAGKGRVNGCVGITGHGVSPELLAEAFKITKKLFDLPYGEKMKAPHPDGPTPHRGYSGTGRERGAAKTETESWDGVKKQDYEGIIDYKESYEIGSEENEVQYNIWLPEDVFPEFRPFTTKFYWELHKAAMAILKVLIESLELTESEAGSVRALHGGHDNQLRLLHYPPIGANQLENQYASRLGAHTDWSAFTMLFQDSHGGLQFLDRASGDFIDAVPQDGVLYKNIGDMFQRVSNGFYPSALHRVVVKNPGNARYSIPYFVPPSSDGVIEPQPSRVAKDGKRLYELVTFKEYSEQMFRTINMYS
ncbi:putative leucoanthocyanidin dioxygenase [Massariosphaeria phaeospora]|uniref:Putative leucoanthocyanidin dioxygenase n=1 Tax=Massariosphaeria phaeospora TaxID=100035 RepID=A0A7C8M4G6_9PLEO|nr:putative leucoanthocyanidin dioxygenase [Massariosphaeria phaeospora]